MERVVGGSPCTQDFDAHRLGCGAHQEVTCVSRSVHLLAYSSQGPMQGRCATIKLCPSKYFLIWSWGWGSERYWPHTQHCSGAASGSVLRSCSLWYLGTCSSGNKQKLTTWETNTWTHYCLFDPQASILITKLGNSSKNLKGDAK